MQKKSFPSFIEIAQESWQLLAPKLLPLLGLGIVSGVLSMLILGVGLGGTLALSAKGLNFSDITNPNPTPEQVLGFFEPLLQHWPRLVAGSLFTMLVAGLLQSVFQIAGILLLNEKKELGIMAAVKRAMPVVVPLLALNVVVMLLALGSSFVFFFPLIFVAVAFAFAPLETVIHRSGLVDSLRRSMKVVSSHLATLILYWVGFIVCYGVILYLIPNTVMKLDQSAGAFIGIARFLLSILAGWYGTAFTLTLFDHSRKQTDFKKMPSLTGIIVLSVIGYLIGFLLLTGVVKALRNAPIGKLLNDEFKKELMQDDDVVGRTSLIPSACGVSIPLPTDTADDSNMKWTFDETEISGEGFMALDKEKHGQRKATYAVIDYRSPDKSDPTKLDPELTVVCVDNTKNLSLDEFVALAQTNSWFEVTEESRETLGDIAVARVILTPPKIVNASELTGFIGVSADGKKLIEILPWQSQESNETINNERNWILNHLEYRSAVR